MHYEPADQRLDSKGPAGALSAIEEIKRKLFATCRGEDWAGYDPYDALNSKLLARLPGFQFALPRLLVTQVLKRSPINFRPILRVPKTHNPKGLALILSALMKDPELCSEGRDGLIDSLLEKLLALRSDNSYYCWGYSFPWQTRDKLVPRGAPNLVCTTFVAGAFLDLYEERKDSACLEIATSAADYILNDLYWNNGGDVAGFGYPLPSARNQVHNANFLAAALLCRVHKHTGIRRFLGPALKAAHYSASRQKADGSWMYGEGGSQVWVDNFHTGFNLGALRQIQRYLQTNDFDANIAHGFAFYRSHFFREDGAPRYFHDRTYPIDIHCVAQSIITLLDCQDLPRGGIEMAGSVLEWAISNMWDKRGYFYYRKLRVCKVKISYMRWSQAWMLLALATLASAVRVAGLPAANAGTEVICR